MFGLTAIPWKILSVVSGITLALALAWGLRVDHLRADWKERFTDLSEEAGQVLFATRQAADNPDLKWKDTPGQIVALGESNKALKGEIVATNLRIDEMARQAVAAKAHAAEMVKIAEKAKAQRAAALRQLSDMAITPGTREDMLKLCAEAEEAINIALTALEGMDR